MARKFLAPLTLPITPDDPASATKGTLYFNTSLNAIKYYDGNDWIEVASGGLSISAANAVQTSSSAPSNPSLGSMYFDTSDKTFKVYSGDYWQPLSPPSSVLEHTHTYDGDVAYVNYGTYSQNYSYDGGTSSSIFSGAIIDGGGA